MLFHHKPTDIAERNVCLVAGSDHLDQSEISQTEQPVARPTSKLSLSSRVAHSGPNFH